MANEQTPIQRQILTPTVNVQAGSGFESLGKAATALATQVSNKLSDIAIEQAAQKGAADGASGEAPKTLMPGLTTATSAYNKAVTATETNRMVESGREQIEQAYLENSDPSKFNNDSPAIFKAQVTGIIQGTVENARPETRAHIQTQLNEISGRASTKMLGNAIDYDNKKVLSDFTQDYDKQTEQLKTASLAGNDKEVTRLNAAIDNTLINYGEQSEQIKSSLPKIKEKLEQQKQVNSVLSSYAHAVSNNTEDEWRAQFSQSKDKIPFEVWKTAAADIIKIKNVSKALALDARAQAGALAERKIFTEEIKTQDQLATFVLDQGENISGAKFLNLRTELDKHNAAIYKSNKLVLDAQENIVKGRPTFNSGSTNNELLNLSVKKEESETGKTSNLLSQYLSINGEGDYPASQIPGVSLGTSVPEYNEAISKSLTSSDPIQTQQALAIANDALFVSDNQKVLDISGQALAMVTEYNGLIKAGMTIEQATESAIKEVLTTSELDRTIRLERYKKTYQDAKWGFKPKIDSLFEDSFKAKSDLAGNDAARSVFDTVFRNQYTHSGSEESALKATKYIMRSWSKSEFFDDNVVSNHVPELEVKAASEGYAFNNQVRVLLQGHINRNNSDIAEIEASNKGKKESEKTPVPKRIEWSSFSKTIDLNNLSDAEKVFNPLGMSFTRENLGAFKGSAEVLGAKGIPDNIAKAKPTVKIGGVESTVYLITGPDTDLNQDGGLRYTLAYKDKFGIQHPFSDHNNNPQGVLQIAPKELDQWAPSVFDDRNSSALKDMAIKIKNRQLQHELDALGEGSSIEQVDPAIHILTNLIPGLSSHSPEYVALKEQMDANRKMPQKEIEDLLRTRINPEQKTKEDRKKITDADVISVEAVAPPVQKKSSIPPVPKLKDKEPAPKEEKKVESKGVSFSDKVKASAPEASKVYSKVINNNEDVLKKYGINTEQRLNYFVAQIAHESRGFTAKTENITDEKAEKDYGYQTRKGKDLGNTEKGDGAKYKGRGLIQLTGKDNYKRIGKLVGVDLVNHPEKAAKDELALEIAAAFWKSLGLNTLADDGSFKLITAKINGSSNPLKNGMKDRKIRLARIEKDNK